MNAQKEQIKQFPEISSVKFTFHVNFRLEKNQNELQTKQISQKIV